MIKGQSQEWSQPPKQESLALFKSFNTLCSIPIVYTLPIQLTSADTHPVLYNDNFGVFLKDDYCCSLDLCLPYVRHSLCIEVFVCTGKIYYVKLPEAM
jgi:hypothetical protein